MVYYTCDRCGEPVDASYPGGRGVKFLSWTDNTKDLCPHCIESFRNWYKGGD